MERKSDREDAPGEGGENPGLSPLPPSTPSDVRSIGKVFEQGDKAKSLRAVKHLAVANPLPNPETLQSRLQ